MLSPWAVACQAGFVGAVWTDDFLCGGCLARAIFDGEVLATGGVEARDEVRVLAECVRGERGEVAVSMLVELMAE